MTERPTPEDLERALDGLRPAPPTDDLMARLRAARPASRPGLAGRPPGDALPSRDRWPRWLPAAAVLAVLASLAGLPWAGHRTSPAPSTAGSEPGPDPSVAAAPVQAAVTPEAAAETRPIFLPVETTQHVFSLQAVPVTQRPDEAPRRLLRAVIVEDTTAVGAETDAALHFRKAREVYLPIRNPVY